MRGEHEPKRTTRAVALPSGLWHGHYEQGGRRHPQQMVLEFADGLIGGDGVVYFTDGRGAMPEVPPGLPVLWVLTHDGPFAPDWGTVVRLPD